MQFNGHAFGGLVQSFISLVLTDYSGHKSIFYREKQFKIYNEFGREYIGDNIYYYVQDNKV